MNIHFARMRAYLMPSALMLLSVATYAATDIANAPISLASTDAVKPNVMFILDDSGSMDSAYSPDTANFGSNTLGAKSNHCNGMYFNPNLDYKPPVYSNGNSYPDADFSKAQSNGYVTSRTTSNLSGSVYYLYNKTGTQKDLDFQYKVNGNVETNTFYNECNTNATNNPTYFTKYTIDANSSDALRTKFANWYSYYRTRILTMKTSAGHAFKSIGSTYRVGYSTISDKGITDGDTFLKIADFNQAQKDLFYTKLYGASASGYTPLRGALSKAGRMYAGQLLTGSQDPVQYSCQQNFAILSTDGYWNTSNESGSYAAKAIDGSTNVGNQDGAENRPMYDGSQKTDVITSTATITIGGSGSTSVTSVKVNGVLISSKATSSSSATNTLASNLAGVISKAGYSATVDGNVVTIKAPSSLGAIAFTPEVVQSGSMSITPSAFTSVTNQVVSGGVSNSLADVAAYYYNTDLRTSSLDNCTGSLTGVDLCKNDVIGSGVDNKETQHMTTFTLGLGVNGRLGYSEDYLSGKSPDFELIKTGSKNWPDPIANGEGPERIDDLWHAAVNGRGTYFSAQTPDALVRGIVKALTGAQVRDGSGAAAATSNLEPVEADNFLFLATFRTFYWDGDLKAKTIDPSTGAVSELASWSAQEKLDTLVAANSDSRTIYTYDGASTSANKLKSFSWSALTDAEKVYFTGICTSSAALSQCADTVLGPNLDAVARDKISGANLVNFIRGQSGKEDRGANLEENRLYRERAHVLGDMIGSQPVYVKAPPFAYVDAGYADFKYDQKDRLAMVYVAANDGMLHAFEATVGQSSSGTEKWAYIPPMVLPNLYKLADRSYSSNHQYYVDGTPTLGDVCPKEPSVGACSRTEWKTILVGGLNSGGKGYYAIDVTDPGNPKALWNFTVTDDADMGLSYGNPIITKLNGIWVAVLTSGYNNGGGKGHLYVLNAYTGALIAKLNTTAGSADTPSGLAKINAWIENTTDNSAKRFYGGDLLGNLWRFEYSATSDGVVSRVTAIAELGNVSPIGVQPITIKPELSEVTDGGTRYPVVSIGTGRYLGNTDLSDNSIQSIYTIKDSLTGSGLGKVRTAGVLVAQTLSVGSDGTRTTSTNPVNWASKDGWYLDLDQSFNAKGERLGERVNVEMQQQLGLLTVAGNVPEANACTPGGYAWVYSLDLRSGQYVQGASNNAAGRRLDGLVAGLKTLKLTNGKTITLVTNTSGTITVLNDPTSNPGAGTGARRVSWRELIAD